MNVYFFYPGPIIEERFKILLSILKVKYVINLSSRAFDISLFSNLDINYHDFSNVNKLDAKVLKDAANVILRELTIKDTKDDNSYCIKKDILKRYSWNRGSYLNPLHNIFNVIEQNCLILYNYKFKYDSNDCFGEKITGFIVRYIMNTINKYSPNESEIVEYWGDIPIDYRVPSNTLYSSPNRVKPFLQKMCFIMLPYGLIDGCKLVVYDTTGKVFCHYENHKKFDSLLSYISLETRFLRSNENLSQFFYGNDNYIQMLKEIIEFRDEAERRREEEESYYESYNNRSDDWGQDAEMNYIINNGGDWILD